ncbi:MAG: hypothetical protein PHD72_00115 [Patescibacteria group bacterium]|nr:hypothetical protein [Patescibacteria group bacterium]
MRIREDAIKDVEIVEPPIQELTRKNRWVGKACMSGCGCLFLFIALIIVGVRLFVGQGPKEIRVLPENFPKEIPVYNEYNIDRITYTSGHYKARAMAIAAFFPKIILSPIFINTAETNPQAPSTPTSQRVNIGRELWRIITKPVGDDRDTVQIEWRRVPSDTKSLILYYQNKLNEAGFTLDTEEEGDNYKQFTFSRADGIGGTVSAQQTSPNKEKIIDYAFLIVNYPSLIVTSSTTTTAR